MMRWRLAVAAFIAAAAAPTVAAAKCYHYDGSPSDVYVCVGRNRDDFADRNKGQEQQDDALDAADTKTWCIVRPRPTAFRQEA